MKQYKDIQITKKELVSVTCDRCGKIDNAETDIMDLQEWQHIHFVGGYDSVFGDGSEYECDLCQQCFRLLLGGYLKYVGSEI